MTTTANRLFGLLNRSHVYVIFGSMCAVILDLLSKAWIASHLSMGQTLAIWPGVFQLTHLQNSGVAFSLFYQYPRVLTVIGGLLFLGFFIYLFVKRSLKAYEIIGFSAILGGALGNLVDRVRLGSVTDFIDVTCLHFAVFNLADSFVFMGIVLLVVPQWLAAFRYDSSCS